MPPANTPPRWVRALPWLAAVAVLAALAGLAGAETGVPAPSDMDPGLPASVTLTPSLPYGRP